MGALAELAKEASVCVRCDLSVTRTQVVFGVGQPNAQLMFVGEAPGREEDLRGEPFVGRSGKLLDRLVHEELGLDRSQFFIANVVKCRPPENRNPQVVEIDACWSWLQQQIQLVDPAVIVPLGNFATRTLLKTKEGITKLRNQVHQFEGRLLVPTFHPSAALRNGEKTVAMIRCDLNLAKQAIAGDFDQFGHKND